MRKILLICFGFFCPVFLYSNFLIAQNLGSNDFWFTFPLNYQFAQANPGQNQIVLVSGCSVSGQYVFPALGGAAVPFTVTPGSATTLNLTANNNTVSEVAQNNGIHITCNNLIAAYAVDYLPYTVDGECMLPTSRLGTDYVVQGYSDNGKYTPSQFTVLATQNNTLITITTSAATTINSSASISHTAGSTWTTTLNAGQTYMVTAYSTNIGGCCTSLTGSRVQSNLPIVVISHSACTDYQCASCDMIMCESLPVNLLGTKYITAQAQARLGAGDYLEITAIASGASYTLNGTAYTLGAYASRVHATGVEANTVIISNNPVQVSQYSQGASCDGSTNTDPEQMLVYPETFWVSDYTFSCSTLITTKSAGVTIVVDAGAGGVGTSGFMIDATAISSAGWTTIGTSTYKYKRVVVVAGPHHLTNTNNTPFSFYQYAVGSDESYIVQGGASFNNCLITLPIHLLSFNASIQNNENTLLTWLTASEENSASFVVERSSNGVDFQEIGTQAGSGNSSVTLRYSLIDAHPSIGNNYYRLKQVDRNGKFTYSNVVTAVIHPERLFEVLSVQPNPTQGQAVVNYKLGSNQAIAWALTDMLGKTIANGKQAGNIGSNQLNIDISNYEKGSYFLIMKSSDDTAILPSVTRITKN